MNEHLSSYAEGIMQMPKAKKSKRVKTTAAGRKILAGLNQLHDAYVSGDFSMVTFRSVEIQKRKSPVSSARIAKLWVC
jgi:hypothetical protein